MPDPTIAPLTKFDEGLNHQIVNTFAAVVESDRGWTEKIWASIAKKDGSLQVDFGLGKYINRNVLDGFAGIARGREQWTVRGSRRLDSDVDSASVGPIEYEIVEPLKSVRFKLADNEQKIAFDIVFTGALPPFFEKRNNFRAGYRATYHVIRYHQGGSVSGWLEIDGERHVVDNDWFGCRDHSWGMRGDQVGAAPTDAQPGIARWEWSQVLWGVWIMTRPDGSQYEIQHCLWRTPHWDYISADIGHPDGTSQDIHKIEHDCRFDQTTREFLGGTFKLHVGKDDVREVTITPVGDSAFHLRTGLYGGWKGNRHAMWRGDLAIDGEYIPSTREAFPELGQLRDRPVRLQLGDDVGYGIQESILLGDWPSYGLTPDSDYPVDI